MIRFVAFALAVTACHAPRDHVDAEVAPVTSAPAAGRNHICEATVACGVWSPCTWLAVDDGPNDSITRTDGGGVAYRIEGDASSWLYRRQHVCDPADAGRDHCFTYCTPTGTGCNDGLVAEALCVGTAPPRRSPYLCEVRGGACVTRP